MRTHWRSGPVCRRESRRERKGLDRNKVGCLRRTRPHSTCGSGYIGGVTVARADTAPRTAALHVSPCLPAYICVLACYHACVWPILRSSGAGRTERDVGSEETTRRAEREGSNHSRGRHFPPHAHASAKEEVRV